MIRRSRLRVGGPVAVPVVLPRVVVHSQGAGSVAATLDGVPVSDGPIPKMQLGEAISQIVEQTGAAVRVEIHAPDGTIHADIVIPPGHEADSPEPTPAPGRDRLRESA